MNQRSPWANRLAIMPIPLLVLATVALWVVDVRVAWTSPPLIWLVHYGPVALGVTFIVIPAARSFLAKGEPSVLMLGCGILMMDIGVTVMPVGFARSSDTAFAIYNTSALMGALSHFAGVAITSQRTVRLRRSATWLTVAYGGGTAAMGLVIWAAFTGWMPVFFIDGQGGTLLRSVVVGTAVALFVLTAGLLWQTNRRAASPFFFWYALGLVLLAAGLAGSMVIAVKDSPLQWVARLTQVVGTIYMCVAVLASAREDGAKGIPLAAVEDAWRENALVAGIRQDTLLGWALRYSLAVMAVVVAMGLRLALAEWIGSGLPTYITFYPMVMMVALLAGFGPGLAATALSALTAAYWILPPVGQFTIASPVDRLGLVIFVSMGLFMSVVAELYRRNRDKAATYAREAAVRESQVRLATFAEATFEGIVQSEAGRIVDCNEQLARMLGYSVAELRGMEITNFIAPEDRDRVMANIRQGGESVIEHAATRKDGTRIVVEAHGRPVTPGNARRHTAIRDITERKRAEQEHHATIEFLRLVNANPDMPHLVEASVRFFHAQSGCEAVGIRLRDGDDYPYYEARGFPEEFLRLESSLCSRDEGGQVARDTAGNPVLECMCGNVICARIDPSKPFFTPEGSFWTNCTTELLASTTEADRQARTRNRCNGQRYESVALIALRCGQERLGLLQLNDHRRGMFTPEVIAFWERLAGHLAVALARARAHEAMRQAKEDWEQTFNSVPDCVAVLDDQHRVILANQAMAERLGVTAGQCVGLHCYEAVHGTTRPPEFCPHTQTCGDHREHTVEVHESRLGGDFLVSTTPRFDEQGRFTGAVHVARDITDSKRAEAALRESEDRFHTLVEQASDAFFVHDGEGRFIDVNRQACKSLGYSREELLQMGVLDVERDFDLPQAQQAWQRIVPGESHTLYGRQQRKDGTVFPVEVRLTTCQIAGQRLYLGLVRDITERKRAEEQIRAALAEKEVLLKEIHHRVKNNMQVISSLVALQAERLPDAAMRAVLQDVTHRVRSMALVHEKLYQSVDMARVEFAEYAQSLLNYLWRAHETTGPDIRLALDLEPVPLSVNAAVPCGLILNELVSNALKHAFRDGGYRSEALVGGEVAVSLRRGPEDRVCLRVRDNGTGLPAGLDWRQADTLGLRLVQMLAGQLDATVDVCSNQGTEFTVTFGGPMTMENGKP